MKGGAYPSRIRPRGVTQYALNEKYDMAVRRADQLPNRGLASGGGINGGFVHRPSNVVRGDASMPISASELKRSVGSGSSFDHEYFYDDYKDSFQGGSNMMKLMKGRGSYADSSDDDGFKVEGGSCVCEHCNGSGWMDWIKKGVNFVSGLFGSKNKEEKLPSYEHSYDYDEPKQQVPPKQEYRQQQQQAPQRAPDGFLVSGNRRINLLSKLGLSNSASKEEVVKAYKKLALKHHPDKGGDPAKFREINDAKVELVGQGMPCKYCKGSGLMKLKKARGKGQEMLEVKINKPRGRTLNRKQDMSVMKEVKVKGGKKRSNPRAQIVNKVMKEMGLSMIEASKYVKENGLY